MKFTPEQLSALSREQKVQILELLQEKKRRAFSATSKYAPNEGQMPVHKSKALLRCVFAGNGGGKSVLAVHEAMWAALGYNPMTKTYTPVPSRVLVVLDKGEKVDDKWVPEIRKWFPLRPDQLHKRGRHYTTQINFDNGSTIGFLFVDQEDMTFESVEANFVVFDEPPKRHVYIGLRRAGREKNNKARYLIVGTPITAAWLRTEIYDPWSRGELKDTECFRFGTEVNRSNLAEGYIEEFSAVLSEKERRIRLHGEFFDLSGLALAHLFDRTKHILARDKYQWNEAHPCVVAIDPHPSKAHYACLVGADEYGPVYLKEISRKCTPREFATHLKDFFRGFRVLDIVCDNFGSAESTGGEGFLSFIQVLRAEGIQVRPTAYDEKVDEDWVMRLQDALHIPDVEDNMGQRIPKLRFLEGNNGIVANIENVQWVKYRNLEEYKPTLDITSQDYLACLKYALACNITLKKQKQRAYYPTKPLYGFETKKPRTIRLRPRLK